MTQQWKRISISVCLMLRWVQQHILSQAEFSFQLLYREFRPDPVTTVRKKKQWQQKHSQSLVTTEIWWMAVHSMTSWRYQQKYKSTVTESNLIIQRLPVLPSCRQEYFLSLKNFHCPNRQTDAGSKNGLYEWQRMQMAFESVETIYVSLIYPRILWTSWVLETNMTPRGTHWLYSVFHPNGSVWIV